MHRHVPRAPFVLAAVLALVGAVAVGLSPRGTAAQDATPTDRSDHPIVGAWHWDNDPADPADDSYGIFHADGTYLEVTKTTNVGTGIGAWKATGERSADVLTIFQDTDPSEAFAAGTATFLLSLTVDETGNALAGTGVLQVRAPNGSVSFEGTDFSYTADRVTVAPLPDFGTPAAGTPTG